MAGAPLDVLDVRSHQPLVLQEVNGRGGPLLQDGHVRALVHPEVHAGLRVAPCSGRRGGAPTLCLVTRQSGRRWSKWHLQSSTLHIHKQHRLFRTVLQPLRREALEWFLSLGSLCRLSAAPLWSEWETLLVVSATVTIKQLYRQTNARNTPEFLEQQYFSVS